MPQATTSDGVRARVNAMSVTTMRSIIDQVGWSHAHIVEKPELRALVGEALTQSDCEIDDSTPAFPRRPGNEHAALVSGSSTDARPLSATADDQTPMGLFLHERERSGTDRLPFLSRLRHRSCSLRLAATFAFCIALSAFILAFLLAFLDETAMERLLPPAAPPLLDTPPLSPPPLTASPTQSPPFQPPLSPPPPEPPPISPPRLPPLRPPPPHPSPSSIVDVVNTRYDRGAPSNSLVDAGVLISQIDAMHDPQRPWLPCPLDDRSTWCWWLGDRISGSIISRQQVALARERSYRPLFDASLGGFIVSPEAVQLNCAYRGDGSTQNEHTSCIPDLLARAARDLADCLPGCSWDGAKPTWCADEDDFSGCSWPHSQLERMLRQQYARHGGYNEIVYNVRNWTDHLPRTIMAVFVQTAAPLIDPGVVFANQAKARRVWALLLREYGLSAEELPLLSFEPHPTAKAFSDISRNAAAWERKYADVLTQMGLDVKF